MPNRSKVAREMEYHTRREEPTSVPEVATALNDLIETLAGR